MPPTPRSPRFLVVRRDNIGDLVCTTPLIAGLRARYPESWIGILANSYNAPILEGNPDIDAVFEYHKLKHGGLNVLAVLWRHFRMILRLRGQRLDVAVLAVPAHVPRVVRYVRLLGARRVVRFVEGGEGAPGLDGVVAPENTTNATETELIWRLAPALDLAGEPPAPRVVASPVERDRATQALSRLPGSGPVVGIHISARKPSQRWPLERFAELMRLLSTRHDARFMLFWAPGDSGNPRHPGDDDRAQALLATLHDLPVLPWPTTHLRQLVGGLAACDQIILSDGGAMHVGAALGKPLVAFFGQSDVVRWRPWKGRVEILQPESRDAIDITVDQTIAAFEKGLGTRSGPNAT